MTLNQVYRDLVEFRNSVKKIKELTPSESPGSGSTIPVWSPSQNLEVQVALSSLFNGINPKLIINGERFLFKDLNNLNEDAIEVDDVIQTLLPNGSLFTGRYLGGNDQDYLNTNVYTKISADYGLQEVTGNSSVTDKVITLPGIKTADGEGFKFFLDNGELQEVGDFSGTQFTVDESLNINSDNILGANISTIPLYITDFVGKTINFPLPITKLLYLSVNQDEIHLVDGISIRTDTSVTLNYFEDIPEGSRVYALVQAYSTQPGQAFNAPLTEQQVRAILDTYVYSQNPIFNDNISDI